MSIAGKIAENVDYSQTFRKISIWVNIHENLDFGQIVGKSWSWSTF